MDVGSNTLDDVALKLQSNQSTNASTLYVQQFGAGKSLIIGVDGSNAETVNIKNDGSANFQGELTTKGGLSNKGIQTFADGRFYAPALYASDGATSGSSKLIVGDSDGDEVFVVNKDGSATFAGDITANNVTYSALDGSQHNIRERIEEAITRVTAIETADLTDDAEHSALLTLIANMSSRITALEAQLAGGN